MATKTEFSQQDFKHILSQFELGTYSRHEPISQGTVQTNYILHTTRGKFVFRYYESRSKESVMFESHLLTYLKTHQYPCPTPFQNKQADCVGIYRGKPFQVFNFMDGEHIEHPTTDQRQQIIRWVAELQNLTQTYHSPYKKYRWNYNIELCRKLATEKAERINTKNGYEKLAWLENQLSRLDLPGTLPKGVCHCDFDFSNILFRDGQFVGLLDFDDANYTFLIFDLVCLIDSWAWSYQSDMLDFVQARQIVRAYTKHRSVSAIEQKHMIEVHKLGVLFDCIWFFERGQANDFYEKRKVEFLNHLGWQEYSGKLFPFFS